MTKQLDHTIFYLFFGPFIIREVCSVELFKSFWSASTHKKVKLQEFRKINWCGEQKCW